MGMLSQGNTICGGDSAPKSLMADQRCTPDYEAMIERLRLRIDKAVGFRDAALLYFEGITVQDAMAVLIGELVTECAMLEKQMEEYVELQDKEG